MQHSLLSGQTPGTGVAQAEEMGWQLWPPVFSHCPSPQQLSASGQMPVVGEVHGVAAGIQSAPATEHSGSPQHCWKDGQIPGEEDTQDCDSGMHVSVHRPSVQHCSSTGQMASVVVVQLSVLGMHCPPASPQKLSLQQTSLSGQTPGTAFGQLSDSPTHVCPGVASQSPSAQHFMESRHRSSNGELQVKVLGTQTCPNVSSHRESRQHLDPAGQLSVRVVEQAATLGMHV